MIIFKNHSFKVAEFYLFTHKLYIIVSTMFTHYIYL